MSLAKVTKFLEYKGKGQKSKRDKIYCNYIVYKIFMESLYLILADPFLIEFPQNIYWLIYCHIYLQ